MSTVSDSSHPPTLEAVWRLMDAIARRDDNILDRVFDVSRVEKVDAYRVLDEYGCEFGSPPKNAYANIVLIAINKSKQRYNTDAYLWDIAGN